MLDKSLSIQRQITRQIEIELVYYSQVLEEVPGTSWGGHREIKAKYRPEEIWDMVPHAFVRVHMNEVLWGSQAKVYWSS